MIAAVNAGVARAVAVGRAAIVAEVALKEGQAEVVDKR